MADEEVVAQAGIVDPGSIPPADSNEELRIAHEKREAAFRGTVSGEERKAAAAKRQAAAAEEPEEDARRMPPQGRTAKPDRHEAAGEGDAVEVPKPAAYAAKPAWVDYAVSKGADRPYAEGRTKEQLVAEYGA